MMTASGCFLRVAVVVVVLTCCAVSGGASLGQQSSDVIEPEEVTVLFNGKDLSGWSTWLTDTKREDPRGVFTVSDGAIRISGDGFGYLSTRKAYKNYRLVAEVKWGEKSFRTRVGMARDSGIFLHAIGPDGNSYDLGWGLPGIRDRHSRPDISHGAYRAAIECQVMEGGFGDFILIPGRFADGARIPTSVKARAVERMVEQDYAKYQFVPESKLRDFTAGAAIAWLDKDKAWVDRMGFRGRRDVESPHGEWTRIECVCRGDRITNFINGHKVNEVSDVFPAAGKIMLQCEGSEIFFRKIELHPLESEVKQQCQ